MFEVEKRGFLTKAEYDKLFSFLSENGTSLGADDKDVVYYIYDDKLLKAVDNVSKGNAKISLKMNKIGNGSVFPETEAYFSRENFEKIKFILSTIATPRKVMTGVQKRHNFLFKNCEFALKWSKYWDYHFEVEKMIKRREDFEKANKELDDISNELDLKIMSDEELNAFAKHAEENPRESLRDLIMEKNKPEHQFNDKESVEWIKMYEPNFKIELLEMREVINTLDEIKKISPWKIFQDEFYVSQQTVAGIHGRNHAIRVSVYALILNMLQNRDIKIDDRDILAAALFHDCARVNDRADQSHGDRSAVIFKERIAGLNFSPRNMDGVLFAIRHHDVDTKIVAETSNYAQYQRITELLKTADSLDRYRFPKIDWWIKDEFLKYIPNESLKKFAFLLTTAIESESSERRIVNYEEIINALRSKIIEEYNMHEGV